MFDKAVESATNFCIFKFFLNISLWENEDEAPYIFYFCNAIQWAPTSKYSPRFTAN